MYDLIPGIGKKYIISTKETGEECDCLLYAMDGSNKICYKNEENILITKNDMHINWEINV